MMYEFLCTWKLKTE